MMSSSLGGISRLNRIAGGRIGIQYGLEDQRRSFASEGQRSRCHFVQNRAERKQVGAGIQLLALGLLRRHVSDGAERRTGAGEMIRVHRTRCVERSNVARRTARQPDLRQSKVENLGVPALSDEDFAGLMSRWTMPSACAASRASAIRWPARESIPFPADARRCDASASCRRETPWR